MPEPRNHNGIVELQGEIWVVGGVATVTNPPIQEMARFCQLLGNRQFVFFPATGDWKKGWRRTAMNDHAGGPVVRAGERVWRLPPAQVPCATSVGHRHGLNEVCWREEPSLPPVGGQVLFRAAAVASRGLFMSLQRQASLLLTRWPRIHIGTCLRPSHPMFGTSDAAIG